ncbi:MAG: diphthine--ammonia ligase [Pedobacter sp.]|jgi:uncharacterized protein (TIGR00290 family)|uniref:Dph6-related ATP pyrophosphatase n=1 Tax=Pedobacter sp. TaxID=1411316 RepID=UPI003565103B
MPKQIPAVFNWSGGKDSTLALHHVLQQKLFDVRYLLTTVNSSFNRISMHGVREALLIEQANSLKLPLFQVRLPELPDMEIYEKTMFEHVSNLKAEGITHSIFGDIFLEDLKVYRENQLAKIGMEPVFPLWKRDSLALVKEFIDLGYKTIAVCAQDGLQDFCGRIIDHSFLNDLPKHIDPCGENGEFHTFVFDGPMFSKPIDFSLGEKLYKTFPSPNQDEKESGYWYIDLIP